MIFTFSSLLSTLTYIYGCVIFHHTLISLVFLDVYVVSGTPHSLSDGEYKQGKSQRIEIEVPD